MKTSELYDDGFYNNRNTETQKSAEEIFSILKSYIKNVSSIIDLGCGVGTFLTVGRDLFGASVICGVDGDYVDEKYRVISSDNFVSWDLEKRFVNDRKYDLAISLEVAEHLSPQRAESFVEDLTNLADVVLFSAAVPNQKGVGHVNLQKMSYWEDKFSKQGFRVYDVIRPKVWNNKDVLWWYRNNTMVFVREGCEKEKQFVNDSLSFYGRICLSIELLFGNLKGNIKTILRIE